MKLGVLSQIILYSGVLLFLASSILFYVLDINKALHIITGKKIKDDDVEEAETEYDYDSNAGMIGLQNYINEEYAASEATEGLIYDQQVYYQNEEDTVLLTPPNQYPIFDINYEETHLGN